LLLGLALLRLNWPRRWKWGLVGMVLLAGLGVFAIRFHHYFSAGATSAGARLDYWRVAVRISAEHPWLGTGPGTFQRPYAELKSSESEMARLAHNDYLEQFSDSGLVGGISLIAWIAGALAVGGRRTWGSADREAVAVFLGLVGWVLHGLGEFHLYIPALAWTAFTLLGWLVGRREMEIDNSEPHR
jgi:O-antigen ligase